MVKKTQTSYLAAVIAALLLGGCSAVAPKSEIPAAQAQFKVDVPSSAAVAADVLPGTPNRQWWTDFNDPKLDRLVALSMKNNRDLKAALASVVEARALAGAARKDYLPTGGIEVKPEAMQPSQIEADPYRQGLPRPPSQRLLNAGQMFSWEIDLFGRIGTAAAMADRQADATAADAVAMAALVQAEVARNYFNLRQGQAAVAALDKEVEMAEGRSARMQARFEAGLVDRREALEAASEHARLVSEEAGAHAGLQAARAALAVLCGRSPGASDAEWNSLLAAAEMPLPPDLSSLVQPSDLLARRPDVAKADALLRASLGNVVLAERAHLPRLTLNVFGGIRAPFGALGSSSATRFSAGPELQWEWLSSGRRKAREAAAKAGSDASWHKFEQTVLNAIKESETSLHEWSSARVALQQAQQAESFARRAADHAAARSSAGLEPPTEALRHRVLLHQAERQRLLAQERLLDAHVQVQLALGAWQPSTSDDPVSIGKKDSTSVALKDIRAVE